MIKKEYNKSISARIRRRNNCGCKAEGGNPAWSKTTPFGYYNDETQNHKDTDYALDRARKNRLGFVANSFKMTEKGPVFVGRKSRSMSKKYANNIQTARGAHRKVSQ